MPNSQKIFVPLHSYALTHERKGVTITNKYMQRNGI